jgi:hypothetical protein
MAKAYKPLPAAEELWEAFDLRLWDGRLIRRPRKGVVSKRGSFGVISTRGYVFGAFNGNKYYAHRLVWAWLSGKDPGTQEIDHVDRNRANNCPFNLRLVQAGEQPRNTTVYKNNALGVKGVRKLSRCSSYQARIRVNGELIHLGCFPTAEEAAKAYADAAVLHFGDMASPGAAS